jgi:hypothetical protein
MRIDHRLWTVQQMELAPLPGPAAALLGRRPSFALARDLELDRYSPSTLIIRRFLLWPSNSQ